MGRKQKIKIQRKIEEARQIEIQNQQKAKRRKLIQSASLAIAFLTAGYITISSIKEYFSMHKIYQPKLFLSSEKNISDNELAEAIKNPKLRQKYLESLISSNDIPYSSGVIYDPDGRKIKEYILKIIHNFEKDPSKIKAVIADIENYIRDPEVNIRTPEILQLSGSGIKPPIFVDYKLFESPNVLFRNSRDIAHIIKYHEGRHAEQFARGLEALGYINTQTIVKGLDSGDISYSVVYILGEIDALNSELTAIENRESNASKEIYQAALKEYRENRKSFEEAYQISSPLQKRLIEKVLIKNPKR